MPCTSNYPEPTERNRFLRHTAKLLIFALTELGYEVSPRLRAQADDEYCITDNAPELCALLARLQLRDPAFFNRMVYDAHRRESRDLATWWEDHSKADAERKRRENAATARAALRQQALAKLTPDEMDALGIKH